MLFHRCFECWHVAIQTSLNHLWVLWEVVHVEQFLRWEFTREHLYWDQVPQNVCFVLFVISVTHLESLAQLNPSLIKTVVVHVEPTLIVRYLNLPIFRKHCEVNSVAAFENLEKSVAKVELVRHELRSNHMKHTEVRRKLSVVRGRFSWTLNTSEKTFHEGNCAFNFLTVAGCRVRVLSLKLIRINQSLSIGSLCVIEQQNAHMVNNWTNPCTIHRFPFANFLKSLETLGKSAKDLVLRTWTFPWCLLREQLRMN